MPTTTPADSPITDETRLTIRIAGDRFATTLGLFMADNADAELDRAGIVAALERGEAFATGGGAAPEVLIERGV